MVENKDEKEIIEDKNEDNIDKIENININLIENNEYIQNEIENIIEINKELINNENVIQNINESEEKIIIMVFGIKEKKKELLKMKKNLKK